MNSGDLKVIDGAKAGAWIGARLKGESRSIMSVVPGGFGAYARIFHPAFDSEGKAVSWAEVAKALGKIAHREMQWHALVDSSDTFGIANSKWMGGIPSLGEMDPSTVDALCEILAVHTSDTSRCFFGLCTIQNWEESFTAEELMLPFLSLPFGRNYIVLAGPLSAVSQIENDGTISPGTARVVSGAFTHNDETRPSADSWPRRRDGPNLIWPADHTWVVASEVDFDSTVVGGSVDLIQAIVDSSRLEAWLVESTDSLTADADEING